MTVNAVRSVQEIRPITFATDAREIALAAYARLLARLEQLALGDWSARTDCAAWDVADMVGHMIGAAKAGASFRETLRQQVWALRHKRDFGGNELDAMNALQVRDHAPLTPPERIELLRTTSRRAVDGRMSFPRRLRGIRVPLSTDGSAADGMPTSLTLGHLMEVIYTRDVWLHTVDIARATDRPLELTPQLDGRIVEDVVAEWARRHGQPFALTLTGAAGGEFRHGDHGAHLELEAVEFCRILSGRSPAEGLLATRVLF